MHELSSIFDDSYSNRNWFFEDYFDSNEIPHYITTNTFENTYLWVINFYFGYDGYSPKKLFRWAVGSCVLLQNPTMLFKCLAADKAKSSTPTEM